MRVSLIVPTHQYIPDSPQVAFLSASDFPTGYGYLASSLKEAGHEVIGCNPNNIIGYPTQREMVEAVICKPLKESQPDLVGIGGLCTDYHFIKDAIKIIRKVNPLTPIVLGGGIVTYDAEFIMNLLKPDYAIVGEGEETIVKLANKEPLEKIPNLWYWEI